MKQDPPRKTASRLKGWQRQVFIFFGALVSGWLAWKLTHYFSKILLQPKIELVFHDPHKSKGAYSIAVANLLSGIELRKLQGDASSLVLLAGLRNFREPWARDLSFAGYGLAGLGEFNALKQSLEAFLHFQLPTGQFPVKLHSTNLFDRYLHSVFQREQPTLPSLKPKYITGHRTISLDGNALLVIAMINYVQRSADHAFLRKHWPALERSLAWLKQFGVNSQGLLTQQAYSDWADSVTRSGVVFYTNVVYWKAIKDLASAASMLSDQKAAETYSSQAEKLGNAIREYFWRPDLGYFITSMEFKNLGSSGNLLAIAWGLADEKQADQILDSMNASGMASPVPTQVVNQRYPAKSVALENRLAGIAEYHMEAAWLWLGAWHVIALARRGRLAESREVLARMDKIIERDGIVYEVHGPDGNPLSTRWYQAEAPLMWNAGMVVYAHHQYSKLAGLDDRQ